MDILYVARQKDNLIKAFFVNFTFQELLKWSFSIYVALKVWKFCAYFVHGFNQHF